MAEMGNGSIYHLQEVGSMHQQKNGVAMTTCASHCGGSCVLRVHTRAGVISRIETDDSVEPQLRACARGRSYRQRVYAPDRLLYPMKRVGRRGEGRFQRVSWSEAIDAIAGEVIRVRDTYGPASILYLSMAGDVGSLHTVGRLAEVLSLNGGFTSTWGATSFAGALYAQRITYGTYYTSNTRDDLVNSRLILLWGWDPATTVAGVNTNWYLAKARESGTRIVAVDPRYTDSAAVFAQQWVPIRPGTDGAMLLAMAHVMIEENLVNQRFLDTYTVGYDKFRDYVIGKEDGVIKTPGWAEAITGVPASTIANLAREYATMRPAALMAGIAPGRTAYGEQYHRIAITLAAMTGNIGIHGGDAAGRAWESVLGGYPYKVGWAGLGLENPVDKKSAHPPKGSPIGYRSSRVHYCDVPSFILKGKAGGYPADCKLIAVVNCSYIGALPNTNRVVQALKSKDVDFIFVLEQFMTPTANLADIVLPTCTFMERNDFVQGVGTPFYGNVKKVIEPLGESKSQTEIATLLACRLGIDSIFNRSEERWLRDLVARTEIPAYDCFRRQGIHRIGISEPYVAFRRQIEDPANNSFPTPSRRIEIYSQELADLNHPEIPPVPKYLEPWEGPNDPLVAKYPLQLVSTHCRKRANHQFDNIPWLSELEPQMVWISSADAKARGISDGDVVVVFNERGKMTIPAKVTERIMPGVVDVPFGAWYDPDSKGVDRGGSANMLTKDAHSPAGAFPYNSCLVEVQRG